MALTRDDLLAIRTIVRDTVEEIVQPIRSEVMVLSGEVKVLSRKVTALSVEITRLSGDVIALSNDVKEIYTMIGGMQKQIDHLTSQRPA